jgi:uncharacterized protein HemY
MTTQPILKISIVILVILLLLLMRVWVQSEKQNAWFCNDYFKDARLANRVPKPSPLRKLLIRFFDLNDFV